MPWHRVTRCQVWEIVKKSTSPLVSVYLIRWRYWSSAWVTRPETQAAWAPRRLLCDSAQINTSLVLMRQMLESISCSVLSLCSVFRLFLDFATLTCKTLYALWKSMDCIDKCRLVPSWCQTDMECIVCCSSHLIRARRVCIVLKEAFTSFVLVVIQYCCCLNILEWSTVLHAECWNGTICTV